MGCSLTPRRCHQVPLVIELLHAGKGVDLARDGAKGLRNDIRQS